MTKRARSEDAETGPGQRRNEGFKGEARSATKSETVHSDEWGVVLARLGILSGSLLDFTDGRGSGASFAESRGIPIVRLSRPEGRTESAAADESVGAMPDEIAMIALRAEAAAVRYLLDRVFASTDARPPLLVELPRGNVGGPEMDALLDARYVIWHVDGNSMAVLLLSEQSAASQEKSHHDSWITYGNLAGARRASALRSQLHSANIKYREAMTSYSTLRSQSSKLEEQLLEARGQARELSHEISKLASLVTEESRRADREREKNHLLRQSLTYTAGLEVRRAKGSPARLAAMPFRLARLILGSRKESQDGRGLQPSESVTLTTPDAQKKQSMPAREVAQGFEDPIPDEVQRDVEVDGRTRTFPDLSELRVAAILDEFSASSFSPDCRLQNLSRDRWLPELTELQPDILLVESAWRGEGGSWHNAVSELGPELRGILAWCNDRKVPTAFWNKEDPVHFSTFLTTAARFDAVYTTDVDSIARYKSILGHGRVYLLPFAVQPVVHHPIEEGRRKEAFSFAGAYYRRYPDRTRDLDEFASTLPKLLPLEIFDRNYFDDNPDYVFPDAYRKYIVGTLAPAEIAQAYKGYRYSINMNSVKQSQSMFARRVFELLASNTITVSNFSRGVKVFFGDIVVTSDSGEQVATRLRTLMLDDTLRDQTRLAGLRNVLSQHTYSDRLEYILEQLGTVRTNSSMPAVALVGVAKSEDDVLSLVANMSRQENVRSAKYIITDVTDPTILAHDVTFMSLADARCKQISEMVREPLIGLMSPDDYYGPNYALDLGLAQKFKRGEVYGKATWFRVGPDGMPEVKSSGPEYGVAQTLVRKMCILSVGRVLEQSFADFALADDDSAFSGPDTVSLDRFGYLEGAREPSRAALDIVDGPDLDTGRTMTDILEIANSTAVSTVELGPVEEMQAEELAGWFAGVHRPKISTDLLGDGWEITSILEDGEHDYLYCRGSVPIERMWEARSADVYVDADPGLNLQFVFIFHDASAVRIGAFFATAQKNASCDVPEGTVAVKIGIRVQGPGRARVNRIKLARVSTDPEVVIASARHLVVTNHYPSYGDLYRNGFVHSRARAYAAAGEKVDVFRLRPGTTLRYEEFEGVSVFTGSEEALDRLLGSGQYRSALVHFLDETMWTILEKQDHLLSVFVWIHGAEVQPWWRRVYNYADDESLAEAKKLSAQRMEFWQRVFVGATARTHFIFVSRYFAEEVMADVGVVLDTGAYSIIHNPIDTSIFTFVPKAADQRLKILSIRPFASPKYANDLSVKAILELASEPWFDELEILFVGEGVLFDETLEPLAHLANVEARRGFLSQSQIAELHKEYGVFLVPTRMDAQGVSRDEAMASGLVPLTNAVAAIPEFVDSDSGFLADGEDASGLADAIRVLYRDSNLFATMSAGAAARVREQSDSVVVVERELRLFRSRPSDTSSTRSSA